MLALIYEMSVGTSVDSGVEIILRLPCICGLFQRMNGQVLICVAAVWLKLHTVYRLRYEYFSS